MYVLSQSQKNDSVMSLSCVCPLFFCFLSPVYTFCDFGRVSFLSKKISFRIHPLFPFVTSSVLFPLFQIESVQSLKKIHPSCMQSCTSVVNVVELGGLKWTNASECMTISQKISNFRIEVYCLCNWNIWRNFMSDPKERAKCWDAQYCVLVWMLNHFLLHIWKERKWGNKNDCLQ